MAFAANAQRYLAEAGTVGKTDLTEYRRYTSYFDQLKQFLIPIEQAERRWIGFRRSNEEQ